MKQNDSAVKVDSGLLREVQEFINKNKFRYASKKQFIDVAVNELLKKERKNAR